MANVAEMEKKMESYQIINRQLCHENNRLKQELKENKVKVLNLQEEVQLLNSTLIRMRREVYDKVNGAVGNFNQIQDLVATSAASFHGLISQILQVGGGGSSCSSSMGNLTEMSRATGQNGSGGGGGSGQTTPLRRVNPMIRTPYGSLVQNLSVRIPRLEESVISNNASVDASEQAELESTATSLYSEEDEVDVDVDESTTTPHEASQAPQAAHQVQTRNFAPVRSHQLEVPEEFNDQTSVQLLEPVPSTSYAEDALHPIAEETEMTNQISELQSIIQEQHQQQYHQLPQTPQPVMSIPPQRRSSASDKENSPFLGFSAGSMPSSTPLPQRTPVNLFPTNPTTTTTTMTNKQLRNENDKLKKNLQVVLPRITNLQEFSQQNNVRINIDLVESRNTAAASAAEPSTESEDEEEHEEEEESAQVQESHTTSRKRKLTKKRVSTGRPKRSRPAPGTMVEPNMRKKLRRSK